MQFQYVTTWGKRAKADAVFFPCYEKTNKKIEPIQPIPTGWGKIAAAPLEIEVGSHPRVLYTSGQAEPRAVLWNLGKKKELGLEELRCAGGVLADLSKKEKWIHIHLYLPDLSEEETFALAEGLVLANYDFTDLKGLRLKEHSKVLLKKVSVFGINKKAFAAMNNALKLCESVHFTRDLVNGNADDVTPQTLVNVAHELAKSYSAVSCETLSKKELEKEGLGLLLAVARGSAVDPALIILRYNGNPSSYDWTSLIGKGVTYDTGGLNIKPTGSMETMKRDMAGSATVLGVLRAAAELKLPLNLTVTIAATENAVDGKSYKPGDVYTAYNGMTVEIGNTDAEGRLTLADALSYTAKKINPERMITIATLTGAIVITLGEETTGLMSNDDELAIEVMQAGYQCYERAWQLPIFKEYKEQLKSDFADIKNTGGRGAGSITSACFLEEFVEGKKWAHLDIAGTSYLTKARRYHPKNATGIGVRLLFNYLKNLAS